MMSILNLVDRGSGVVGCAETPQGKTVEMYQLEPRNHQNHLVPITAVIWRPAHRALSSQGGHANA